MRYAHYSFFASAILIWICYYNIYIACLDQFYTIILSYIATIEGRVNTICLFSNHFLCHSFSHICKNGVTYHDSVYSASNIEAREKLEFHNNRTTKTTSSTLVHINFVSFKKRRMKLRGASTIL